MSSGLVHTSASGLFAAADRIEAHENDPERTWERQTNFELAAQLRQQAAAAKAPSEQQHVVVEQASAQVAALQVYVDTDPDLVLPRRLARDRAAFAWKVYIFSGDQSKERNLSMPAYTIMARWHCESILIDAKQISCLRKFPIYV